MNGEKKQSARDRKAQILADFLSWTDMREAEGDWEKYIYKTGDKLNRSEIAKELCFARSAWTSNKELQNKLIENHLQQQLYLDPHVQNPCREKKCQV